MYKYWTATFESGKHALMRTQVIGGHEVALFDPQTDQFRPVTSLPTHYATELPALDDVMFPAP